MQDLIDFIKDIKLINQMRHKIQKKKKNSLSYFGSN